MSMVKCKECSAQISDSAATCPQCGAKLPKKTSKLTWAVVGTIGVVAIAAIAGRSDPIPATKPQQTAKAQPSPESRQVALAREGATVIREAMRDPESLKFDYIGINQAATIACFRYRAKNGFGGMNVEALAVVDLKFTKDPAAIKKACTPPLIDWTTAGVK